MNRRLSLLVATTLVLTGCKKKTTVRDFVEAHRPEFQAYVDDMQTLKQAVSRAPREPFSERPYEVKEADALLDSAVIFARAELDNTTASRFDTSPPWSSLQLRWVRGWLAGTDDVLKDSHPQAMESAEACSEA